MATRATSNAIVALSKRLDAYHLDRRFRLLCTGLDIQAETNDKELDFQLSALFSRLKQIIPHGEAVLFSYSAARSWSSWVIKGLTISDRPQSPYLTTTFEQATPRLTVCSLS